MIIINYSYGVLVCSISLYCIMRSLEIRNPMTSWYLWSICGIHLSPTHLKLNSRSISFDEVMSNDSRNDKTKHKRLDPSRYKNA